jgi:sugar/nucleoside kinase (ribokinase family)
LKADFAMARAGAAVISREDLDNDDELIEHMAHQTRVLAVTESAAGVVLYWNGDRRRFRAPQVTEVDPTGAGDIFAAAFLTRLFSTRDPWEAARFATLIATRSVARVGLEGIPTAREIEECKLEILH